MPTALITGAGRGIGLEFARQYAERGWRLLLTVRNPAVPGLPAGRAVEVASLDVTDHEAVADLAARWRGETIDVLVNNAGTYGPQGAPEGMAYQGLAHMDYGIWRQILEVNLLAPFAIAVAFREHVARSGNGRIVMMSSDLGSVAQNRQGGSYAYRSSKAGLNMIARGMAVEWADVTVVAMAPGWTRTDLGGAEAPLSAAESVKSQLQALDRLTRADSGRFINRFGETVPW